MKISEIIKSKYNDKDFLEEIRSLSEDELEQLELELTDIKVECKDKLKEASIEFKETGVPANSNWWKSTNTVATIRSKQCMMIRREREVRKH